MTHGSGKYDREATLVRQSTQATAVLVCVIEGNRGSGFSVQATEPIALPKLARLLRNIADQIERDARDVQQ